MIGVSMTLLRCNDPTVNDTAASIARAALHAAAVAFMLAGLAWIPAAAASSDTAAASESRHTLLVLGDSISAALGIQRSQGWVALLAQRLHDEGRPWQVVNASMSGETTGGGLARLPQLLEVHEPDVVLIELGGNDALRGYPLEQIATNLRRMSTLALDAGAEIIIAEMQIPPNYDPRNAAAFAALFHEVAAAFDADVIPFLLEDVALEPGLMQRDGIHPTARAQPIMLDAAWPVIERVLDRATVPASRGT
jgi:acyl-CoA thioesterase I